MKKPVFIFLIIIGLVGTIVFWDSIKVLMVGMSPVEMVQFVWSGALHVAVVTICMYALYTLPEIVKPLMRTFRWKQRQARKHWKVGPDAQWKAQAPRMPRMTAEQKFFLMMAQANGKRFPNPARRNAPTPPSESHESQLRIKL